VQRPRSAVFRGFYASFFEYSLTEGKRYKVSLGFASKTFFFSRNGVPCNRSWGSGTSRVTFFCWGNFPAKVCDKAVRIESGLTKSRFHVFDGSSSVDRRTLSGVNSRQTRHLMTSPADMWISSEFRVSCQHSTYLLSTFSHRTSVCWVVRKVLHQNLGFSYSWLCTFLRVFCCMPCGWSL